MKLKASSAPGLFLILTMLEAMRGAQAQAAPGVVRCGKLLDVRTGRLLVNQLILWDKDGRVTSTGAVNSTPSGMALIELLDSTCLPGLIDVHTHITFDPQDSGYKSLGISVPRETVIGVKNARLLLLSGFTSIRNVGASHYTDVAVRDSVNAGDIPGPASINAADLLGQSGKVGALEKGCYADIIAVRGNPLDEVTILEHVSFVMKGGTVYRNDITR